MQGPLYSPLEMGNNPAQLLETLNGNHTYRALFEQAFGTDTIALDQVYTAVTAFEGSLISLNSRYDLYAHGYHAALNEEEIAGLNVFRSFVARCASAIHRRYSPTSSWRCWVWPTHQARSWTRGRGHHWRCQPARCVPRAQPAQYHSYRPVHAPWPETNARRRCAFLHRRQGPRSARGRVTDDSLAHLGAAADRSRDTAPSHLYGGAHR